MFELQFASNVKNVVIAQKDCHHWSRTWYVYEVKLHAEERIKIEKAIESEGKEELMKKGKHGLYIVTHARQSAREVWMI